MEQPQIGGDLDAGLQQDNDAGDSRWPGSGAIAVRRTVASVVMDRPMHR